MEVEWQMSTMHSYLIIPLILFEHPSSRVCYPPCSTSQVWRMWRNQSLLPSLPLSVSGGNFIRVLPYSEPPQHWDNIHNRRWRVLAHPVWQVGLQQSITQLIYFAFFSTRDHLVHLCQLLHWLSTVLAPLVSPWLPSLNSSLWCMSTATRGSLMTSRTWQVPRSAYSWHHHENLLCSGVRPGPYWQIMWRFISPALMSAVIASSMYFMLTNNPKYSAWNKEEVRSNSEIVWSTHILAFEKRLNNSCNTRPNLKIASTVTLAWCSQQSLPSPVSFPLLEEQFFMWSGGQPFFTVLWVFHICVYMYT